MTDRVTIPREEYERLLHAAGELAKSRARNRTKVRGPLVLPEEYQARLIAGERPVRVIRDWRGMRAADLARASGIHKVVIHNIEAGKSRGSVASLIRIAAALHVTVDDLL
jgi:DNA-binding XRE family transcriptional regulator